jgi:molybdopterin adenylyltransferase
MIPTGIITIGGYHSDPAFRATPGPALRAAATAAGWRTIAEAIVPGDASQIAQTVRSFALQGCHLILINGGTGLAAGEVTPEAIRSVARLEIPGFGELIRRAATSPDMVLSRCLGAAVEHSLVVALPGTPGDALAALDSVAGLIPPAVSRLRDEGITC